MDVMLFLLFFAIFATVLLQVATRFVPTMVFPWTDEIIRLSFMWMICLAAPLAIRHNEFAQVDMLFQFVSFRTRLALELLCIILVTIFCFVAGYTALPMIQVGQRMTSVAMQLPMSYFFGAIPMCFFLAGISGVFKSYERLLDVLDPQRVIDKKSAEEQALKKHIREIETSLEQDGVSLRGKEVDA